MRRQNTVVEYIEMRTVLDLCEEAERWPVMLVSMQWWDHGGLDLAGDRALAAMEMVTEEAEGEADAVSNK